MNKTMTKASLLAIAFIVSIPLGLQAQDEGFYPYSYARLSYVNGTVYVQRTSDLGYEKGEINLALVQGDKMGTESGQAEIHFGRRNYLRIDDNTKIEFAVLPTEGDERIKLHLTEGSAYLRVSHLAVDKGIEVHTPDASFYVLEEGLYRFDVRLDRETLASVREGSLEAAAEDGSSLVRENESVTAADGRLLGDPESAYSREDGFDTWNSSRDAQLSARSEQQYLPSEMEEYEEELDQNGQWVYERGYGNVWVPNVSYADWRPYLYGRWVYYPIIGWNWVSSEPWGWSVYHYGRWHWRFGLGWYWIPRNHWGPAWVHWWWDRDHIGWCPLSWYNRPVLLVDNHFYDRHYDRYFSAHNRAMTVVRRDQLQARDLSRRQLGAAERGRIGRVELRGEQPSIRPVVDNARPQALAAKRALAARPGSRNEVRSVAPSNSLSPSRMRPGSVRAETRTRDRSASIASPERGTVSRPSVRSPESGTRTIRSYPRQDVSGNREQSGVAGNRSSETGSRVIRSFPSQRSGGNRDQAGATEDRRTSVGSPVRKGGTQTRDNTARVSRPDGKASEPVQPRTVRDSQRTRTDANGSGSGVTRKSETIKNYPSTARSESSSGRSQSRTYAPRSSVSRTPSRLSSPSATSSRSSSSVSRPSSSARSSSPSYARSGSSSSPRSSAVRSRSAVTSPSRSTSPSYSRPSPSRTPSSSRPRSSYSAPSRSSGSSGRTMSAPRSSSSSGRSYSAPRSSGSSGRSYSAPRSSGSSGSGRSSSSGRSGSSSSRSSGSSSKSGSVKRKG